MTSNKIAYLSISNNIFDRKVYRPSIKLEMIFVGISMRTTLCLILALAATLGLSACEDYSHDFETLKLDFSTPEGNPVIEMSDDGNSEYFFIVLQDGTSMFVFIEDPDLPNDKSLTSSNAESLWLGRGNKEHSPLTTDRLVDGRRISKNLINSKVYILLTS